MSLSPGTRLGPYEIASPLGAGGMGEVYRARDSRLDRDVAIKILPAAFVDDADRRARFEREAKAVAALSHPNIVNLFDTGVADGQVFVVMELLAGETLRERLARGPIPVRKTIEYGVQIARGLAAAHDKGLVHRDLKPDNIFLLADGQLKILDFGLARHQPTASSGTSETAPAITDPGSVIGTVGYMSPEQIRGQTIDGRSDLFALGAVLYEMLTGRRAFQRATAAETMTAVLRDDPPDLVASSGEIPPALDRIVRHCLEKNPVERFQAARDVAFALTELSGSHPGSGVVAAVPEGRRWSRTAAMIGVPLLAFAAGLLTMRGFTMSPAPVTFDTKTLESQWISRARFAHDGQAIIFSAATAGNVPELFVLRPGAMTAQPLGQPATHLLSVSSKDELAIITGARFLHHFLYEGMLAKMPLDGAPRPLMENVREADWSPDGTAMAIVHVVDGRDQLEYPIGKVLHAVPTGYLSDPRVSPDGSHVAFMEHQVWGDNRGWVKVVTPSGEVKTVAGEYWGLEGLAWAPDSQRVYFSASVSGEAYRPVVAEIAGAPNARQTFSSPGMMLMSDINRDGRQLVMRHDRLVSLRGLVPGERTEREFGWLNYSAGGNISRDAKSMAFGDLSPGAGVNYSTAVRDLSSGKVVRVGEGSTFGYSPDGHWIGSQLFSTGDIILYPSGPGQTIHVARGAIEHYSSTPLWFPRSARLLVCGNEKGKAPRCYAQDLSGAMTPLTPEGVVTGFVAPDERTLLTVSAGRTFEIRTAADGPATPARGFGTSDFILGWHADGRSVITSTVSSIPARIERVDPFSGTRTVLKELAPPDRTGLISVMGGQWIDNGRGYVYQYQRSLSTLYVVTGVR